MVPLPGVARGYTAENAEFAEIPRCSQRAWRFNNDYRSSSMTRQDDCSFHCPYVDSRVLDLFPYSHAGGIDFAEQGSFLCCGWRGRTHLLWDNDLKAAVLLHLFHRNTWVQGQ